MAKKNGSNGVTKHVVAWAGSDILVQICPDFLKEDFGGEDGEIQRVKHVSTFLSVRIGKT